MNSMVVYGSHFGNTRKIAEAIADELATRGTAKLLYAPDAPSQIPEGMDLLVVGGPTEALHMTAEVSAFLSRLERSSVEGVAAAAFDTRVAPRWWLHGYAGPGIARKLSGLGAVVIAPPEGFLVEGKIDEAHGQFPTLVGGELERARRWAAGLAEHAVAVGAPREAAKTAGM